MHRRTVLAAAGATASALLAGCNRFRPGDAGEPPLDGEWTLQGRVRNADEVSREWRVESRSEDRDSLAAASGVLPPGGATELTLTGRLYDETRTVYVESDRGAQSTPWEPTECRRLFADVTVEDGKPALTTTCRER